MTTRLNVTFTGSPDEGTQTFIGVMEPGQKPLPFARYCRWRRVNQAANTWTLEIDALPLDRPALVLLVPTSSTKEEDIILALDDLTNGQSLPMIAPNAGIDAWFELSARYVEVSDRLFVLNSDGTIDEGTQRIIEYANEHGRPVVYLRY